jgi:predicted permease
VGAKLVVLELGLATVLLAGAGLLSQSLYHLLHVELGFQPDRLATLFVAIPPARYANDNRIVALARQLMAKIDSLPAVESAAIASRLPVSGNGDTDWIRFAGRPYHGEHNEVNERDVSAAYFKTIGAKLLRGRYFTDDEDASKPNVAIINQALARKYFPGEDPLGRRFGDIALSPKSMKQIVGVVDDIREGSLDSEVWPAEYRPFNQSTDHYFGVVVRVSHGARAILPEFAAAIHKLDPGIVIDNPMAMNDRISNSPSAYLHRSAAWLVGGFASVALLLSAIGVYGVLAYSVSRRTREIGVRMALGAEPRSVHRLVLKEAGRLSITGVALGILSSVLLTAAMRSLLFGVRSWDLPTLAAVGALLACAALLASYLPARRAAAVNPVDALRAD